MNDRSRQKQRRRHKTDGQNIVRRGPQRIHSVAICRKLSSTAKQRAKTTQEMQPVRAMLFTQIRIRIFRHLWRRSTSERKQRPVIQRLAETATKQRSETPKPTAEAVHDHRRSDARYLRSANDEGPLAIAALRHFCRVHLEAELRP